jgi:AcrR family transcriptional regulator
MDEVVSIAAKRGASGTKQKVRPRTKPPEVRREEIMDAAQSPFLKQGVGPTTIDHAASAADVAKATVYLHFTSKQDLLVVLGAQFAEKRLAHMKSALLISRPRSPPNPGRTGPASSRHGPRPASASISTPLSFTTCCYVKPVLRRGRALPIMSLSIISKHC